MRSADWKIRCQSPSAQAFGDRGETAVTGLMQGSMKTDELCISSKQAQAGDSVDDGRGIWR